MGGEEFFAWIGRAFVVVLSISLLRMLLKPRKSSQSYVPPEEDFDEVADSRPEIAMNRAEGSLQLSNGRKRSRIAFTNLIAVELRQNGQLVAATSLIGRAAGATVPTLAVGPNGFVSAGSNEGLLMSQVERLDLILFTSRPACGETVTFWQRFDDDTVDEQDQQEELRESAKDALRWFTTLGELVTTNAQATETVSQVA